MRLFFYILFIAGCVSWSSKREKTIRSIEIKWVNDLPGDYRFKDKWSYQPYVYKNQYGQLSCDGYCPAETERMKDINGKIHKDSLTVFYRLVDTTHFFHSIQSETTCSEWAGTDYIDVRYKNGDTVLCSTIMNAATHCSLQLSITKNTCQATINLISILPNKDAVFHCTGGNITIDKTLWKAGIMKSEFHFDFQNNRQSKKSTYWRGNIYAAIRNNM